MSIAYHSVLILDEKTFFHVLVGSHYNCTNVSRTDSGYSSPQSPPYFDEIVLKVC